MLLVDRQVGRPVQGPAGHRFARDLLRREASLEEVDRGEIGELGHEHLGQFAHRVVEVQRRADALPRLVDEGEPFARFVGGRNGDGGGTRSERLPLVRQPA
nr:hypothetical protein [Streptomyces sp. NRRL F-5122]